MAAAAALAGTTVARVIETAEATDARPAAGRWRSLGSAVERHRALAAAGVAVLVGLPLIIAVIALHGRPWRPVLDLAMTELRVRDVGTAHTPLIGLPGRIGTYPDQGSHPGPLSFYLLAPTYRLLGSSSWALEAATVAIHLGAIAVALWIGHRRLGWPGVAVIALVLAMVIRGYGQLPLTQPWNPYLPLVAWLVVLLAAWSVLAGDSWMLVVLVAASSYCAQTHVPYLPLGVGMVVLGLGAVVVRWRQSVPFPGRPVLVALVAGVVLWLPPVADQIRQDPGNIRQLLDHFGSPPEAALGAGDGVELALRHLDVWAGLARQTVDTGTFITAASAGRGLAVLVLWIAAAVVAWRRGSAALRALHIVVAAGLVLGTASMVRIFGRPWYYLTLWAWGVTTILALAVAWSALALVRPSLAAGHPWFGPRLAVRLGVGGAVLTGAVTIGSTAQFADAQHPEERLSAAVGALAGPAVDAVDDGVGAATGADGRYLVRWSDAADIGSPGFGLLDELERRGLDVAADTYFRVPATGHRTQPRAWAEAQIHLATGGYVERWRAWNEAVEVATYDPRTPAQVAEYAAVRERLWRRLHDEGLPELADQIDTNLFGISVDTRLSEADLADLAALIELGQPMAVFIAPPPSDDDPTAL